MIKRIPVLLVTMIISTICLSQPEKKQFEILGKVTGLPDGTLVYLYQNKIHQADKIDSAFLVNNQFHFKGSIQDEAVQVILQTKDQGNYKFFWLENSVINFTVQTGKFKDAIITGSKTQEEQKQFDSSVGNDKLKSISYIRSHPASILSVYILSIYARTWGKDTSNSLYDALTEKMKETYFGQSIFDFITLSRNPKVGDQYVDFGEPDKEDKIIHLSNFKNKVILLDFWGSWCGPCRANNPKLVKLYNEFKSKGFEIFSVAADIDRKSWIDAINKDGLNWTNVSDLKGWENKAAVIYGINKYPTNYLIDRRGVIVAIDLEGDDLRKKLIEIIE
jgi:thiol-disulfide isomerase/thioredoxin